MQFRYLDLIWPFMLGHHTESEAADTVVFSEKMVFMKQIQHFGPQADRYGDSGGVEDS